MGTAGGGAGRDGEGGAGAAAAAGLGRRQTAERQPPGIRLSRATPRHRGSTREGGGACRPTTEGGGRADGSLLPRPPRRDGARRTMRDAGARPRPRAGQRRGRTTLAGTPPPGQSWFAGRRRRLARPCRPQWPPAAPRRRSPAHLRTQAAAFFFFFFSLDPSSKGVPQQWPDSGIAMNGWLRAAAAPPLWHCKWDGGDRGLSARAEAGHVAWTTPPDRRNPTPSSAAKGSISLCCPPHTPSSRPYL